MRTTGTQTSDFTQTLFEARDNTLVGGKAVNLGKLIRGGFPVPGGFVVTTQAYHAAQTEIDGSPGVPRELPGEVADAIVAAYRAMGAGTVAVRSSATAEDMGNASMAGQYETFLDIEGEEKLLESVRDCWASLDSPRIRAYLHEHGIERSRVAMAVVVQRLVTADVAGVLFTVNPNDNGGVGGGGREMLVEASWGLGESVVSGRVQPDVLRLDQETGRVIAATIADKQVVLLAGNGGEQKVEDSRRKLPCLRGKDVHRLWQLGRRAAEHFGAPQDIEWAIFAGELYLLQSRPITTREQAEAYEDVLRKTREHLRKEVAAGRGPWALHNLAETLPHPTPLTWSVIGRFMSGSGGFGLMYRQAGFDPSAEVEREGFLERIAGRVYMDAARAPEMFFAGFPFAYEPAELRKSPDVSQTPPTVAKGTMRQRMAAGRRLAAVNVKLHSLSVDFDQRLTEVLFPTIVDYVKNARNVPLDGLSTEKFVETWHQREKQVLDVYGAELLMPSLISGMALGELRTFLAENFWEEDTEALAQLISSGGTANRTLLADAELHEVGQGKRTMEQWLTAHGHRASGEFDLASRRWREQPDEAQRMAVLMGTGDGPMERFTRHGEMVHKKIAELRAQLSAAGRRELDRHVTLLRRYVLFREDGKDLLMLGYDLLRDLALEAARRLEVGEDIFYLTREDIFDALAVGFAPLHLIAQRKAAYLAESRITLPRVIEAADIESLGETAAKVIADNGKGHKAFAISSGEAMGPVRILRSPTDRGAADLGKGYILVCPSTDPSWTPLFVNAAGLILECGGTLSHGAVVAREMGLPAVVLPDATRMFSEGEEILIDGRRGWVGRPSDKPAMEETPGTGEQDEIPRDLMPPPEGAKDRRAAQWRNRLALAWSVYLLAFFLLPEAWVHQPTLKFLDLFLWPIVRNFGRPAVVAVVAGALAIVTLLMQKLLTDNRRLCEAKRRAAALRKQADALPLTSPRRKALLALAAPVQMRTLMAALVPVGILLGPMVMPFVWFKERIDPAVLVAPVGTAAYVTAKVDANDARPVTISLPPELTLDETTPASRTLPPIRETLENLLKLYQSQPVDKSLPWELQLAPDVGRQATVDDLKGYLDAGIPPEGITWLVRPPPDGNDRYPIAVGGTRIFLVTGDRYAPDVMKVQDATSPIKELSVTYVMPAQEKAFWRPFGTFDIGWLWLYIAVYLPLVLVVRFVLRVA